MFITDLKFLAPKYFRQNTFGHVTRMLVVAFVTYVAVAQSGPGHSPDQPVEPQDSVRDET